MRIKAVIAILACANMAHAGWSPDLPLSSIPVGDRPVDNYSVYASNMLAAVNERAGATGYAVGHETNWVLSGTSFQQVTNDIIIYYVDPLLRVTDCPWPTGLVTEVITPTHYSIHDDLTVRVSTVRFDIVYTNGTWISNDVTAIVTLPWSPYTTFTSLVHRESVYVGGDLITNLAYDASITNKVVGYGWVETGAAYDVLRDGMYTNINGAHWPVTTNRPHDSWSGSVATDGPWYIVATEPVTGVTYVATTTNVIYDVAYRLYNPTAKNFEEVIATVVYTNYYFAAATGVVGYTYMWMSDAVSIPFSYDAWSVISVTNNYRVLTNDTTCAPTLTFIEDIRTKVEELVPYFLDSRESTAGDFTPWLSATYWLWHDDYVTPTPSVWKEHNNNERINWLPDGWSPQWYMPQMPRWTLLDIYTSTGAGTDLYRVTAKVDSTMYPGRPSPPYTSVVGQFDYDTGIYGWQVGDLASNTIVLYDQTLVYITNSNPQPLLLQEHDIDIELGRYQWKMQLEATNVAGGFSSVYWYYSTNDALVISTNDTWLAGINDCVFSAITEPYGACAYRYFVSGSYYIFPLLTQADDYYDSAPTAIKRGVSWVIVDSVATGKLLAENWASLFGSDINFARSKIHQMGYPTKVNDYNIGQPSTGPSGYYYPGGYLRPTHYIVGLTYTGAYRVYANDVDAGFGTQAAYLPYVLDNMVWTVLTNWPAATVTVTANKNTTTLPSVDISVTGHTLYLDDLDMLIGYAHRGNTGELTTNTFTSPVTTGVVAHAGVLLSIVPPEAGNVVTTQVWDINQAWNMGDITSVTDKYYVASARAGYTNVVISAGVTNKVYTLYPVVTETTYTLSIDPSLSAINSKYVFSVNLADLTLYDGSSLAGLGQTLTGDFVDSMYLVLNELLYTDIGYDWVTVYPGTPFDVNTWQANQALKIYPYIPPNWPENTNHIVRWQGGSIESELASEWGDAWESHSTNYTNTVTLPVGLSGGSVPTRLTHALTGAVASWSVGHIYTYPLPYAYPAYFQLPVRERADGVPITVGTLGSTPPTTQYSIWWCAADDLAAMFTSTDGNFANIGAEQHYFASWLWNLYADWETLSAVDYLTLNPYYAADYNMQLPYPRAMYEHDGNGQQNVAYSALGVWPTSCELVRPYGLVAATVDVYVCPTWDGVAEWEVRVPDDTLADITPGAFGFYGFSVLSATTNIVDVGEYKPYHGTLGPMDVKGLKATLAMPAPSGTALLVTNTTTFNMPTAIDVSWTDVAPTFTDDIDLDNGAGNSLKHSVSWQQTAAAPYIYNLWYPNIVTKWDFDYK